MVFKGLLPFCFGLIILVCCGMAQRPLQMVANFRESCLRIPCDDDKNLVCNRNNVCECQIDRITHAPWVFIERMAKCIQVLREDEHVHPTGINPGGGFGGSSPPCISINKPCLYTQACAAAYGPLGTCKLHPYDSSANRCACCHPTQETGYYNDKCHFVRRIGENCDSQEQCILGAANSQCRNGICSYSYASGGGGHQGGNGGNGFNEFNRRNSGFSTSAFISATLIMSAGFLALSS